MCEAQGFQKELDLFFGSCQDGEISHEEGVGLRLFELVTVVAGYQRQWEDRGKFASYALASSLFPWDNQCPLLHHRNWQQLSRDNKRVAQTLFWGGMWLKATMERPTALGPSLLHFFSLQRPRDDEVTM